MSEFTNFLVAKYSEILFANCSNPEQNINQVHVYMKSWSHKTRNIWYEVKLVSHKFPLDLTFCLIKFKSTKKFCQIFVAFLQNLNFKLQVQKTATSKQQNRYPSGGVEQTVYQILKPNGHLMILRGPKLKTIQMPMELVPKWWKIWKLILILLRLKVFLWWLYTE